jgi:hypothetical protein
MIFGADITAAIKLDHITNAVIMIVLPGALPIHSLI